MKAERTPKMLKAVIRKTTQKVQALRYTVELLVSLLPGSLEGPAKVLQILQEGRPAANNVLWQAVR